jgi:hypothetical protein
MSNTDAILAVVISGCPIDAEKWQYTPAELKEIAERAKQHEDLPVVKENLSRLGVVPEKPTKESKPAVIDLTEEPDNVGELDKKPKKPKDEVAAPAPVKVASLAELAPEAKPKRVTRKARATKKTEALPSSTTLSSKAIPTAELSSTAKPTTVEIKPKTKIVAAVTKGIKKKAAKETK